MPEGDIELQETLQFGRLSGTPATVFISWGEGANIDTYQNVEVSVEGPIRMQGGTTMRDTFAELGPGTWPGQLTPADASRILQKVKQAIVSGQQTTASKKGFKKMAREQTIEFPFDLRDGQKATIHAIVEDGGRLQSWWATDAMGAEIPHNTLGTNTAVAIQEMAEEKAIGHHAGQIDQVYERHRDKDMLRGASRTWIIDASAS